MEDLWRVRDVLKVIGKHKKRAAPKSVKGPVAEGYRLAHDHIEGYLCLCVPTVQSETESKWIPVEEQLPETDKLVLVVRSDGDMAVAGWNAALGWLHYWSGFRVKNVTHWMPLPKPPKEK